MCARGGLHARGEGRGGEAGSESRGSRGPHIDRCGEQDEHGTLGLIGSLCSAGKICPAAFR